MTNKNITFKMLSSNKLCFFILFAIIILGEPTYSQPKAIDTLIQRFLVENEELDTIIFNSKKINNKIITERNYFINKTFEVRNRYCFFIGYIFGNASHLRSKYIAIDFSNKTSHIFFILGKEGFENDLNKILNIFCSNNCALLDKDKKRIIQAIMKLYTDRILEKICNKNHNIL